ncbi:hypothetical protein [Gordonia sp. NPDC003950]
MNHNVFHTLVSLDETTMVVRHSEIRPHPDYSGDEAILRGKVCEWTEVLKKKPGSLAWWPVSVSYPDSGGSAGQTWGRMAVRPGDRPTKAFRVQQMPLDEHYADEVDVNEVADPFAEDGEPQTTVFLNPRSGGDE